MTNWLTPLKLNACPTTPDANAVPLLKTPSKPPTTSLVLFWPGHQFVKPAGGIRQLPCPKPDIANIPRNSDSNTTGENVGAERQKYFFMGLRRFFFPHEDWIRYGILSRKKQGCQFECNPTLARKASTPEGRSPNPVQTGWPCGKSRGILSAMTTSLHHSESELAARLGEILASPPDDGRLEFIVARLVSEQREVRERSEVTSEAGLPGDRWASTCSRKLPDGRLNPDSQITIMNTRCLAILTDDRERWPLAGTTRPWIST